LSEVSAARGAACRAVGVAAGATLAFDDSTLNRAKWFTRLIHAGGTRDRLNDEKQRYRDNHHPIASGVVVNTGTTSTFSYVDPGFNTRWTYYTAPYNFNDDWHTIGAEWDAGNVTLFIDGRKIYTRSYAWNHADGTPAGPAHILLNLAVGGSWAGRHGIDDSAFPQSLDVDWVRAYRKGP